MAKSPSTELSSPLLKAQRQRLKMLQRRFYRWIIVLSSGVGLLWLLFIRSFPPLLDARSVLLEPRTPIPSDTPVSHRSFEELAPQDLILSWSTIFDGPPLVSANANSLTVILPVASHAPELTEILNTLLHGSTSLKEVIVLSPENLFVETRQRIWNIISVSEDHDHPDLSLRRLNNESQHIRSVLDATSEVSTDFILILDERGLENIHSLTRNMLLNPSATALPFGPRGFAYSFANLSCIIATEIPQPATFLVPPMVVPSVLLHNGEIESGVVGIHTWAELGRLISHARLDMVGGVVVDFGESDADWCPMALRDTDSPTRTSVGSIMPYPGENVEPKHAPENIHRNQKVLSSTAKSTGIFIVVLDSSSDLRLLSGVLCRLQNDSHHIHILLYDLDDSTIDVAKYSSGRISAPNCDLTYQELPAANSASQILDFVSETLNNFHVTADIILSTSEEDHFTLALALALKNSRHRESTYIRIPKADLPYCDWMGALSLQEWKHWNIPHVDVSVITNDRPQPLTRLLSSLSNARYFGDTLNLRINMDQTADQETSQLVENFRWDHGSTFVHHRVIHGGLLPAVVESWYPHSNDSYGLLLEDDVELSPLFYAWVKMAILRYRYSEHSAEDISRLFGISLYQQKTIELRPEGRRPFDARTLFADAGISKPNTPYLSQIPCSWGAVYFPEHWREFHDYLAIRLSESSMSIHENVVPNVRSNNWSRSWKKYFIELVYLRGYVMLYPNYSNFTSLSTNHLEIGSHVKSTPKDLYAQKKELFHLPLMRLPDVNNSFPVDTSLLDMPDRRLPPWPILPTLDLSGSPVSSNAIVERGSTRRGDLFECSKTLSRPYDARALTCLDHYRAP